MDHIAKSANISSYPFYTIGHSTRSIEEFASLLKGQNITLLLDVRTVPRSWKNPQYNKDALPESLKPFQIQYKHIEALGGLRNKRRDVSPETNAYWEHESFRNYADYAMGQSFRDGLAELIELGRQQRCAIMCAEAVWWKCHRRIITDYLLAAGQQVLHIMDANHVQPAQMTNAARLVEPGILAYPAE
jgi:uncharacterized protein (DUF488 family)